MTRVQLAIVLVLLVVLPLLLTACGKGGGGY
jgi:predicted small secreted protein